MVKKKEMQLQNALPDSTFSPKEERIGFCQGPAGKVHKNLPHVYLWLQSNCMDKLRCEEQGQ